MLFTRSKGITTIVLFGSLLMFSTASSVAQAAALNNATVSEVSTNTGPPDPQIVEALKQVSAQRIQATIEKLVTFKNRSTLSSNDQRMIAQGLGASAAAKWIQSEFESYSKACGGCLQVKTDSYTQEPGPRVAMPTPLTNVYAVLQGADAQSAKRIYLVTGHYDSRNSTNENTNNAAPGANDDASGTAVSLECARVLSQYKFPATLVFLSVAGEEQGLYGSKHFAKMAKDQGWDIEGALNNDIVGGNTTPGDSLQKKDVVRVFSEGIPITATQQQAMSIRMIGAENDSPSRELARYIRSVSGEYLGQSFQPMPIFRQDRYLRGGDHTSFNEQGFPAVRFTEYREDYHHQHQDVRTENGVEYGDLAKFVDFSYVANVARLNAATLASLALAPAPPQNVRLVTKQLENDSTIAWDPGSGSTGVQYELLWRATDQPYWEHATPVPNGNSITVPESKDNVIFGVRARDAKGHFSPAVIPRPQR